MNTVMPSRVMGKVAGFLIVRHTKDKIERLEFTSPQEFAAEVNRVTELHLEFGKQNPHGTTVAEFLGANIPMDEWFTLIRRDDNGEVEEYLGADISGETEIGQVRMKVFCGYCGENPEWFRYKKEWEDVPFECGECYERGIAEDRHDYLNDVDPEDEWWW